jgi:hypothetical protein
LFICRHLGDFWPKKLKSEEMRGEVDPADPTHWKMVNISDPLSLNSPGGYAYNKWPVSNPGGHGFDEWHSTEASASSTTCNCACEENWLQGGCISGGGEWSPKPPGPCTNYWGPTDLTNASKHSPTRPECHNATQSPRDCVFNMTTKIGITRVAPDTGDDTEHIMNTFEEFLKRKAPGGPEETPFMAALWLHTNHVPHPGVYL